MANDKGGAQTSNMSIDAPQAMSLFICIHLSNTARINLISVPHVYTSDHHYVTLEAHYNRSYYARTLPPVPKDCPTPFGVAGM